MPRFSRPFSCYFFFFFLCRGFFFPALFVLCVRVFSIRFCTCSFDFFFSSAWLLLSLAHGPAPLAPSFCFLFALPPQASSLPFFLDLFSLSLPLVRFRFEFSPQSPVPFFSSSSSYAPQTPQHLLFRFSSPFPLHPLRSCAAVVVVVVVGEGL
ncbi:hypothetical protein DFJ73DRAFT_481701 [Zopfochytrium polystomum]|nr:hypothetical protein DFJ73DRAFT_481701 [Zopfochytrium polystomum]